MWGEKTRGCGWTEEYKKRNRDCRAEIISVANSLVFFFPLAFRRSILFQM